MKDDFEPGSLALSATEAESVLAEFVQAGFKLREIPCKVQTYSRGTPRAWYWCFYGKHFPQNHISLLQANAQSLKQDLFGVLRDLLNAKKELLSNSIQSTTTDFSKMVEVLAAQGTALARGPMPQALKSYVEAIDLDFRYYWACDQHLIAVSVHPS